MRQALLYALALCFALPCASQTSWHETYGGGTNDELMGVVYTDNGFVSAGYFGGFINLGTESFFSSGSSDVMVLRHDEDGGLDWAKSFGGAVNERAVAVDVDDAGNLYVAGNFYGPTTFAGTAFSPGDDQAEIFVLKLNPAGDVLWATSMGGPGEHLAYDITVMGNGDFAITGHFRGNLVADGISLTGTTYGEDEINTGDPSLDFFVAHGSSDGSWDWVQQGATESDATGVAISHSNSHIYLTGQFSDSLSFGALDVDNTVANAGFVSRLDLAGNVDWITRLSAGFTLCNDIVFGNNRAYVVGDYNQILNVYASTTTSFSAPYDKAIFVASFQEDGELDWLSTSGSESALSARGISLNSSGSLDICGHFQCRFDGFADDSGTGLWRSVDMLDAFVCQYSSTGDRLWARHTGGLGDNRLRAVCPGATPASPCVVGSYSGVQCYPGFAASSTAWSSFSTCDPGTAEFCGYENYFSTRYSESTGGYDFAIAHVEWETFPLLDPYHRYTEDCTFPEGDVCFSLSAFTNQCDSQCPDTLVICTEPETLYAHMPFEFPYYTNWDVDWTPGGSWNPIWVDEGTYSCTVTSNDECYVYTNEVEVIYAEPSCPLIWDELEVNEGVCETDTVSICGFEDLQLWAEMPGGQITGWVPAQPPTPMYAGTNPDGIEVISSDLFTVTAIDSSGCLVSNSVVVEIGHQIEPIDGYLEVAFIIPDLGVIQNLDTVILCEPGLYSVSLLDALGSEWLGLNVNSDWTLSVNGVLDAWYMFDGEVDGMYDTPHSIVASADETGWVEIEVIYETFWDEPCPENVVPDTLNFAFYVEMFNLDVVVTGPNELCPGECLEWEISGITSITNVSGSFIEIIDSTGVVSICESGTYWIYYEVITDECFVESYYGSNVYDAEPPTITAFPEHFVICPGDSLMLSTWGADDYQWYGPLGEPLGTDQNLWVTSPGAYSVGVTEDGCYLESIAAETYEYNTPYIDVTPSNDLCFENEVLITVITNEESAITWVDPLFGTGLTQVVTEAGFYYVTSEFCGIASEFEIEVIDTPVDASILGPNYMQCEPGDVVMLSADSTMATFIWNGTPLDSWTYEALEPGEYTLDVTNVVGCVDSDTVTVYTPADAVPDASTTGACAGDDVELFSGIPWDVYWSDAPFGTDTLSTENDFVHPPLDAPTWFYVMHADTTCGLFLDSVLVDILAGQILSNDSSLCLPSTLTLDAECSLNYATISWTPAGNLALPTALSTPVLSNATTTYQLTLSTPSGCVVTDQVTLTQLTESTSLPDDIVLCEGDSYGVSVPWPEEYDISWTGGQTGPTATYTETTDIVVNVTSPTGCASSAQMDLSVLPYPVLPYPSDTTLCAESCYDLYIGNETNHILWNTGDSTSTITVCQEGWYSTIVTNGPCVTQDSIWVEVLPLPVDVLYQDTVVCFAYPPYEVTLDAGNPGSSYAWSTGDEGVSVQVSEPGFHTVYVTLPNGCGQLFELNVQEFCDGQLFIPNTFTPNNDGINDTWNIVSNRLLTFEVWVFNRWGEVVYNSLDPDQPWIGDHQGGTHFVPDGVYTYLVKAEWLTHEGIATPRSLTGHVTVIR